MQPTPIPNNEEQRVQALYRYNILDTEEEQNFDDLAQLASYICDVPIAVITLIEKDRVWLKSSIGLNTKQIPRDIGFCAHAINQTDVFLVPNTKNDDRFHNNPLVTGDMHIRFYAGSPLITPDNYVIGSLSIMDKNPRELTQEQISSLQTLSRQIITLMELRFHMKTLNQANAQLLEDQELLKKANRHKSAFLSNMSHEIRTPLNSILGFNQLLQLDLEECDIPSDSRQYFDYIDQSGQHLLSIINDILDISKIEADKMEVNYSSFNLKEFTDSIYQTNAISAKNANIKFSYHFDSELPAEIISDRTKVSQILMNLISNAFKFTPANGSVSFSISNNENHIVFEISDTGIGIPKEKLHLVFFPFEQGDSSKSRNYDGTGLGLSISKKLIEFLDGEITVTSEVNKGSCFKTYLPFNMTADTKIVIDSTAAQLNFNPHYKNILVVEDNPQNQEVIKRFLQTLEINTTLVESGDQAIEAVSKDIPDLILMDIHLPGINGFDATEIILSSPDTQHIPIVALTADIHIEQHIKAAGFATFLAKPLSLNALIDTLNKHLS